MPEIIENNTNPVEPFKAIKQKGAYDPAINKKIIEWSSLLKKAMTRSLLSTIW